MIQPLHIQLLGDFQLMSGDTPVAVATPRLQSLLAYLVLHRSVPQKRSHLAFLLWPDSSEAQAHSNLRKLLYQLRQILPDVEHFVSIDRHTVQWQPSLRDTWTLDVLDIEEAIAGAKQADQDTAVQRQALQRIVELYRGKLLPDCYDEWVLPEQERMQQMFFEAAKCLLVILEQERDYDSAIKITQRLLHFDSLNEAMYSNLMHLYALRGDRGEALRAYHMCATVLERELGITPGEATRQVYEALLNTGVEPPSLIRQGADIPLESRGKEWEKTQETWLNYYQAGEVAQRIFANAEAIQNFQQAITLLEAKTTYSEQHSEHVATLYERLGGIFETTRQLQEARASYQQAMAHVPIQRYVWQARLHRKSANTWKAVSANPQEAQHIYTVQGYQEAERILEQAPAKSSADWLQEWIDLQLAKLVPLRASSDDMTNIIERAKPIIERHGNPEQRGLFFLTVCLRDLARNRYVVSEETVLYCRNALAAILRTNDIHLVGFAQFALGVYLLWSGHLDEAEDHLRIAMHVGKQIGHAMLCIRCMTFLPFIYRQRGHVEAVRNEITHALSFPGMENIKIITGHRAWLAWRDGDIPQAETYARATVENWQHQKNIHSFYWAGVWPLIAIVLAREDAAEAMGYVRMLLDPTQQLLPEKLLPLLERALQAWDAEQCESAYTLLQQALPVAKDLGYL